MYEFRVDKPVKIQLCEKPITGHCFVMVVMTDPDHLKDTIENPDGQPVFAVSTEKNQHVSQCQIVSSITYGSILAVSVYLENEQHIFVKPLTASRNIS